MRLFSLTKLGLETWNEQSMKVERNLKGSKVSTCGIQKGGWQEERQVELRLRDIWEPV